MGLSRVRGQGPNAGMLGHNEIGPLRPGAGPLPSRAHVQVHTEKSVCTNATSQEDVHRHSGTHTCMGNPLPPPHSLCIPPGTKHSSWQLTEQRTHTRLKGQGAHGTPCWGHRAGGWPGLKAPANPSQPHLPDLNGPQSGGRNKTKGMAQSLASALPSHPCPQGHPIYLSASEQGTVLTDL